jgi:hypothetical protein
MASYTITGHPLNYADIGLTAAEADLLRQLETKGIGTTLTLNLAGPTDAAAKAHGLRVSRAGFRGDRVSWFPLSRDQDFGSYRSA